MRQPPDLPTLRQHLVNRAQLIASGHTDRAIQRAVARREYLRIAPGWFVRVAVWQSLSGEDQHLIRALCTHERLANPPVFSHQTAAAILGLPLLKFDTSKPHVLLPDSSTRASCSNIIRHHHPYAHSDTQQSGSLTHTSLARTAIDMARSMSSASFASAVVTGDAALRRLDRVQAEVTSEGKMGSGQQHNKVTHAKHHIRSNPQPLSYQDAMLTQLAELPRTRGARRGRQVLQFLDGSSESPLESLYRLQFARLGFQVRTQVLVSARGGGFYRMDFELLGYRVFFEADGKSKYLEDQYLRGRSPGQVLIDERDRENWVSGSLGYRVVRGGWEHALTPEATAKRLRSFKITPPRDLDKNMRLHLY